jgi:hypothetical protein
LGMTNLEDDAVESWHYIVDVCRHVQDEGEMVLMGPSNIDVTTAHDDNNQQYEKGPRDKIKHREINNRVVKVVSYQE